MADTEFETRSTTEYKRGLHELQRHMDTVLDDELLLAWVLAGGRSCYLRVFTKEFRGMRGVDRHMGELLWDLFRESWHRRFPARSPGEYLDNVVVSSSPTPREIEDAWVVESASSDDARRYFGTP